MHHSAGLRAHLGTTSGDGSLPSRDVDRAWRGRSGGAPLELKKRNGQTVELSQKLPWLSLASILLQQSWLCLS